MATNVSFNNNTPDDEFTSDAAQAAIAANDYADAAAASAAAAEAALAATLAALGDYLPLAGGTMTGKILLDGDPTLALHAATKQYVDDNFVDITGDTMTGALVLSGDPTVDLGAATKQYVDDLLGGTNYDIAVFFPSLPVDGYDQILLLVASTAFQLPAGLTDSEAYCLVTPDAETVYTIEKNGTQVGTITFAAEANTATFSMASDQTFLNGDRLEIVGPEYADIYQADISFNLKGSLA